VRTQTLGGTRSAAAGTYPATGFRILTLTAAASGG
jgi:hypothetical protein